MLKRSDWRLALPLQVVLVGGAVLLYFGVRGVTERKEATAFANARDVLRSESNFWLDVERSGQDWLLGHEGAVTLANWVYIWGHWPVIIATLGWLFADPTAIASCSRRGSSTSTPQCRASTSAGTCWSVS